MYQAIVTIHILSGFAWVGGGFLLLLAARNIKKTEGQQAADDAVGALESTTKWLFGIAPPLVLVTGIVQVLMSVQHDWTHFWIMAALVLFGVTAFMGAGISDRWEKQMKEAREDGRSLPELFDRWVRLGWIEVVVVVAIVALMVFKPV